MSINYTWACGVCSESNPSGSENCKKCQSPSQLNSLEISKRKLDFFGPEPVQKLSKVSEPSWFDNASMGLNENARSIGNVLFISTPIILIMVLSINIYMHGYIHVNFIVTASISLFSAFDIWNFCRGNTTYIESRSTSARIENTGIRWLGLGLDIVFLFVMLSQTHKYD